MDARFFIPCTLCFRRLFNDFDLANEINYIYFNKFIIIFTLSAYIAICFKEQKVYYTSYRRMLYFLSFE